MINSLVTSRRQRPCRQRIIGFKLHHRPHDNPGGRQSFLEQGELGQQFRFDAFTRLVSRPQSIAKRFDDVIGGDCEVCRARLDHSKYRSEYAPDGTDLTALLIACRGHRVIVAEQFVRAVD